MATSYTSDKKIGALTSITGSLSATDEIVVNKNGDTLKAPLTAVESFIFGTKTLETPQTGDAVVVRRGTNIRQLTTENLIPDGAISNAKIGNAAAIQHNKLATMPSASVLLGNASNTPTATTLTGDVTVGNTGVTAISTGVIVNADIKSDADIALSKLKTGALPVGITVNSDNIVNGSIENEDISGTANIDDTKLATISTAGKVANSATSATNANTPSTIVRRDASGNFSAGTVTADLVGNATSATKLSSNRTFALTGKVTGSVQSDTSSGVTISTTIANSSVGEDQIVDGNVTARKLGPIERVLPSSDSYTITAEDSGKLILMNFTSANTVYLPVGLPIGTQVTVIQNGTGQTSFAAVSPAVLRTTDNFTKLYKRWSVASAIYIGTNSWLVAGDIIA